MFQILKKRVPFPFKINKNTGWLIALSIVIAICQFCVYALINKNLGKEMLGVWSLIIAATSIGQISSFGFSNSLVRYLPEMLTGNQKESIVKIVGTINFSNFFLTLPLLLILYYPALQYATHLLNGTQLLVFKSALPACVLGLFVNSLFSVYSYLLDAMQKYYLRSAIQIAGWILFLLSSLLLMPLYGLRGVAISFLLQNGFQFVIILVVVARKGLLQKTYPIHFNKFFFSRIFSFGIKSQYINVLVILFDPLIKFFITKYIGLTGTANYEFSNKIVMQARNLLVNSNQVIIPQVVLSKSSGTEEVYFKGISRRNTIFSISIGLLLLLVAPAAIFVFSGRQDNSLMQCIILLNIGWVCNMITSIHYYCCMGLDKMWTLVYYHLLLSVIVVVLYLFFNRFLHYDFLYYVVPAVALFLGSVYNSWSLSRQISMAFSWLRSGIFIYFIFVSLILLVTIFTKMTTLIYLIIPVLLFPYFIWLRRQYKMGKI